MVLPFKVRRNGEAIELTVFPAPKSRLVLPGKRSCATRRSSPLGQVLVLMTMAIIVLAGFAAMTVDVGQFWTIRRSMQTAADAGAVAGAVALRLGQNVAVAAQEASSLNGFTDGSEYGENPNYKISVTVNNPPKSGTYSGNSEYVEVIVAQPLPTYFMNVLGYSTVKVSARAVAGSTNAPACVYALDPSVSGALTIKGSSSMTLGCGAMVDSTSSTALTTSGGGSLTATSIGVAGGYSGSGFSPTPVTGIAPSPDPFSYLQRPSVGSCSCTGFHDNSAGISSCTLASQPGGNGTPVYLNPGVYCGGIQITGSVPIVFNRGLYILEGGGISDTGSGTLSGTGVTFYNTYNSTYSYGAISLNGGGQMNFSAPTSGSYKGILFYQDPSVPKGSSSSLISGNSGSTFDGTIYFPTTGLSYSGNSSSSGYTILVGDTVSVSGNSTFGDNYSSLADGSPLKATSLYE
jgi:Putative Tad-like Flp pilus-assembly